MSAAAARGEDVRLALLDVDGTLTNVRSVWQHLLEHCGCWAGTGEANLAAYLAGEISYEEFCHLDAELLRGQPYAALSEVAARIPLNPGIDVLFGDLRAKGYHVALVSTGLRVLTDHLERRFGVEHCVANDLAVEDGLCTGRAVIDIGETDKGVHARKAIERFGATHVVAIGDGTGDVPMFAEADLAIAVGPVADVVRAAADVHLPSLDLAAVREHL